MGTTSRASASVVAGAITYVYLFQKSPQGELNVLFPDDLIPVKSKINSENDVELEAVRVERVLGGMEHFRNRANVIVLDACRNNPFARSWRSGSRA